MMLFSVIIPTYNRKELLHNCLNKIVDQKFKVEPLNYEIIVSDDAKCEDLRFFLKDNFPDVKYLEGPQKGPAANRNNGAKHALGKWLIFLDDDCIPDSELLLHYYYAIILNPQNKVFEGRIFADRKKKIYNEEAPLNESGNVLWSCNFCIKRDTFNYLGGFDENFPYAAMEDYDLHYRIVQKSILIKFVYNAAVMHPWRKHAGQSIIKKRHSSLLYFLKKHPQELNRYTLRYMLVTLKNICLELFHYGILRVSLTGIKFYTIKIYLNIVLFYKIKKWKQKIQL